MALKRDKEVLTQERLHELLDFDPATGAFSWKVDRQGGRGIKPGARAGSVKPTGSGKRYRYIRIDQVDYLAKRLAWFWVNKEWPSFLRCADGNEDNCAIDNLIDAGFVSGGPGSSRKNRVGQRKRYVAKHPDRVRDNFLQSRFGLSLEEYKAKHAAQDGKCSICEKPETATRGGKIKYLSVDHCHSSEKVRDLLCGRCNSMIGYANDETYALQRGIEYLVKHGCKPPWTTPTLIEITA